MRALELRDEAVNAQSVFSTRDVRKVTDDPIKVIVAEDDEVQRMYLTLLLENLGYDPVPATDGVNALKLLQQSDAQIVISDYQMPNMNGLELTKHIRAATFDHYVHIIMITGRDEDDVRAEALEAGVDDFLTKGRSPIMLKARVRAAARLVMHARELAESNRVLKEAHERLRGGLGGLASARGRA